MCGIAGALVLDNSRWSDDSVASVVPKMISAMRRRGPDGTGFFRANGVSLGHARLSIIDLEGGAQPLFNEDETVAGVVNGEIYDYQSIRDELRRHHSFRTKSDSELLVHLWEDVGARFKESVNGMYSYAIYDGKNHRMEIGIDPVGIKPLYWSEQQGIFFFASEIRGMVAGMSALGIEISDDPQQVQEFLLQGWVLPGRTALHDVNRLLPGESILVGRETSRTHIPYAGPKTIREKQDLDLRTVLGASVERQLVADVPVGVFLSGGIDSSVLTALASRKGEVSTFTVRFEGGSEADSVNEADIAAAVAKHLHCRHHEVTVSDMLLRSRLSEVLDAQDDLIADPAVLPLSEISALAADSVKVCLTGDGGDELFGGYLRHTTLRQRLGLRAGPDWIVRMLNTLRERLPTSASNSMSDKLRKARLLLQILLDNAYVGGPFSGDFEDMLVQHGGSRWRGFPLSTDEVIDCEILGPLSNHMLVKTDRISMWHGLEVRVPFLDDQMIAFARSMAWSSKVDGRTGKLPLRRIAQDLIPPEIANRPKHGFRVPIKSWFKDTLFDDVRMMLLDGAAALESNIPRQAVEKLLDEHRANSADHSLRIWSLLVLSNWRQANRSLFQRVAAGEAI